MRSRRAFRSRCWCPGKSSLHVLASVGRECRPGWVIQRVMTQFRREFSMTEGCSAGTRVRELPPRAQPRDLVRQVCFPACRIVSRSNFHASLSMTRVRAVRVGSPAARRRASRLARYQRQGAVAQGCHVACARDSVACWATRRVTAVCFHTWWPEASHLDRGRPGTTSCAAGPHGVGLSTSVEASHASRWCRRRPGPP